jgi:hypothetical protein
VVKQLWVLARRLHLSGEVGQQFAHATRHFFSEEALELSQHGEVRRVELDTREPAGGDDQGRHLGRLPMAKHGGAALQRQ